MLDTTSCFRGSATTAGCRGSSRPGSQTPETVVFVLLSQALAPVRSALASRSVPTTRRGPLPRWRRPPPLSRGRAPPSCRRSHPRHCGGRRTDPAAHTRSDSRLPTLGTPRGPLVVRDAVTQVSAMSGDRTVADLRPRCSNLGRYATDFRSSHSCAELRNRARSEAAVSEGRCRRRRLTPSHRRHAAREPPLTTIKSPPGTGTIACRTTRGPQRS
jgi:hypothetical protein